MFLKFSRCEKNPFFITKCLQVSTLWQNWPCGNSDSNYSGSDRDIKGTLMQIWKSPYMFGSTEKSYPKNFLFSILINLELFTRAVCVFLKNWANFLHILLCPYVCKETVYISWVSISHEVFYDVIPSLHYFYVKTEMLANFQIWISVTLNWDIKISKSLVLF